MVTVVTTIAKVQIRTKLAIVFILVLLKIRTSKGNGEAFVKSNCKFFKF